MKRIRTKILTSLLLSVTIILSNIVSLNAAEIYNGEVVSEEGVIVNQEQKKICEATIDSSLNGGMNSTTESVTEELNNYGIDVDDIYIPDLPYDSEPNASIVSVYDPRDMGYVTPIKNQRNQGTCSIFASIAMMEQKAYMETGVKNSYSEEACKFLTSKELRIHNNISSVYGFYGYGLTDGRNIDTNIQYLTNRNNPIIANNAISWIAPNYEADVQYTYNSNNSTYLSNHSWPVNINSSYTNAYVSGMQYINIDEIKENIIDNGAVYITIGYDGNYVNYTNSEKALYNSASTALNHAVAIVGWDDNYSKDNFVSSHRPPQNGAWLVKNSWGCSQNDNGYIWVSYYDLPLNESGFASAITDIAKVSKNEYMLSYDYTPMTWKTNETVTNNNYYIANVYDLSGYYTDYRFINKVMFYASNIGDTYDIYVVPADNGIPNISQLSNSFAQGVITHEGYTTAIFDDYYSLSSEYSKYAVIVKFTTYNDRINISRERTYSSKYQAVANRGESFYYSNNTWRDICGNNNILTINGNYCIRPTILTANSVTNDSKLSEYTKNNLGDSLSVSMILNGNQLYSIKELDGAVLYEDIHYNKNGSQIIFKRDYVNGLNVNDDTKIVFEFTDGQNQVLTIKHKKRLGNVNVIGNYAVGQELSVKAYTSQNNLISNDLLSFQWQYKAQNGGWSNIPNANDSKFTITEDYFLKFIRVSVSSNNNTNIVYPGFVSSIPNTSSYGDKVILYGDADLDGDVTITDVTCLQRYLAELESINTLQLRASDVDGDGEVTISDVTLIQYRVAEMIEFFPVEE